ncbi:MAG TPA: alpha/beta hydrolase domain-containing protein [Vicinamibacterales bacterium]|nr:alpha/beta hydrolase domain-containing protein [Vicinamibacterales bacterium]
MIARTLLLVVLAAAPLHAEVVRIDVRSRADVLGGQPFGDAGPYEKLAGTIHFAVDPQNPANRIITDIALAPRNAGGKVEFSSDFYLLRPKTPDRGNGTLLFEVSNRGGKAMIAFFNRTTAALDPQRAEDFGDGFLLRQGFTLLWVGWQFDPPLRHGLVRVAAPVARAPDGSSIQGLVRSEILAADKVTEASLADRDHLAYPVANPGDPDNALTVRDTREGARRTVPRAEWQFTADGTRVRLNAGFEPGKIYEVVYRAQDPPVAGVGLAAIRDAVSKLKYGGADELSLPQGAVRHAIGFGISQSGRLLRTFLYYGFNADESNRKVFDGVMAHVAGGGRGSFNLRFAQPSRDGHPYMNFFYPTDIFPFSDTAQRDPETGREDGLLTHATPPPLQPRIFYTNSSYEYWGRAASLVHTTLDGRQDLPLPAGTRVYLLTAGQHGVAGFPPARTIGQQTNNPLDYRWTMRALLVAMRQWVADGVEPPPSAYPRIDDGTLVPPDRLKFPSLPGVARPGTPHKAYRADYGPEFVTAGIVAHEPPRIGSAFPVLVPQVDADGNELAGVRVPELSVPLATYTGWNLFNERSGPTDVISSMQGSFIPLRRSREDRERARDPRLSVDERYKSREHYLELVSEAARALAGTRYVLDADVPAIIEQAGSRWDYVTSRPGSE